jgi:UDP-N-acetylmuramoyl-L-alanyl-D-glutamate--2,6-diaminopimelate ligase
LKIIEEIEEGTRKIARKRYEISPRSHGWEEPGYAVIPDRREAIREAIGATRQGDMVLIAGKGHEDYQILGTQKIHFDDREEAAGALASLRREADR